ncbi:hypothetical protein HZB01_00510 [Candidatus Woesearchaeota archaeon]|nr:hypothetical protein [Candidatus Woesearchaeota archaeon]
MGIFSFLKDVVLAFVFGVKHRKPSLRETSTVIIMRCISNLADVIGGTLDDLREERAKIMHSIRNQGLNLEQLTRDTAKLEANINDTIQHLNVLFDNLEQIFLQVCTLLYQEDKNVVLSTKTLSERLARLARMTERRGKDADAEELPHGKEMEAVSVKLMEFKLTLSARIKDFYLDAKHRRDNVFNVRNIEEISWRGDSGLVHRMRRRTIEARQIVEAITDRLDTLHKGANFDEILPNFQKELEDANHIESAANTLFHRAKHESNLLLEDVRHFEAMLNSLEAELKRQMHLREHQPVLDQGRGIISNLDTTLAHQQEVLNKFETYVRSEREKLDATIRKFEETQSREREETVVDARRLATDAGRL